MGQGEQSSVHGFRWTLLVLSYPLAGVIEH